MYEKILKNVGLTPAQAEIYIALLKHGPCQVGNIIEKTQLQSSVVHNNVNKLIDQGLITYILIGKIKKYNAIDPSILLQTMQKKKQVLEEQYKELQKHVKALQAIKAQQEEPKTVELFEGKRGFKAAYAEQYKRMGKGYESYFIAQPPEFQQDKELHQAFLELDTIAQQKHLSLKGIAQEQHMNLWQQLYGKKKTYSMYYSTKKYPWGIMTFKDTVLISFWGDKPMVIKIQNKTFTKNTIEFLKEEMKVTK
jgi:predicted transcriptional regulator